MNAPDFTARRLSMVDHQIRDRGISAPLVLDAMSRVRREQFVPTQRREQAYDDGPLQIGHGQTISQPWVVARMTELLVEKAEPKKVLEIGTGCGYQTAVLAALGAEVYSVERIKPLQEQARKRIAALGFAKVQFKHADGGYGWASEAPFDAILAACGRPDIPKELLEQLADGGRLVMPVGERDQQWLTVVDRVGDEYQTTHLDAVRFVPFQRGILK